MSPMDKVALDLYAISISQGTQKLFGEGEDVEASTEGEKTISTEESEITTEPITGTGCLNDVEKRKNLFYVIFLIQLLSSF